ncbi:MAG: (2Fe-2S)-binding protein [Bacillota bacterium]
MRITEHPILENLSEDRKTVTITIDGQKIQAYEGEPIAAALWARGIKELRQTPRFGENRGIYCGIGRCTDCMMTVDGVPNVRTCVTPVADGMVIETQNGLGRWS